MELSVGFGPGEFSGVVFGLEVFVAFCSAEFEHLAVVTHEGHPVARVHRTRTEIALVDTHFITTTILCISIYYCFVFKCWDIFII